MIQHMRHEDFLFYGSWCVQSRYKLFYKKNVKDKKEFSIYFTFISHTRSIRTSILDLIAFFVSNEFEYVTAV